MKYFGLGLGEAAAATPLLTPLSLKKIMIVTLNLFIRTTIDNRLRKNLIKSKSLWMGFSWGERALLGLEVQNEYL